MTSDTETIERIVDKVEFVADATGLLARKQSLEREEYLADREQQAIVEREFQVAIEACIDIAELLIRDSETEISATKSDQGVGLHISFPFGEEQVFRYVAMEDELELLTYNPFREFTVRQLRARQRRGVGRCRRRGGARRCAVRIRAATS